MQADIGYQRLTTSKVRTSGQWLCLVLIFALVLSTSSFIHAPVETHAAVAASLSHDVNFNSLDPGADSEPCDSEHDGRSHDATCSTAGGCSFCVPMLTTMVLMTPLTTELRPALPDAFHRSRVPTTLFRPPILSANA